MMLDNVGTMLDLEGTKTTPTIQFDPNNGYLLLEGRSSPENSLVFYEPLFEAIKNTEKNEAFNVDIKLVYFNTSTVRCLNLLLQLFSQKKDLGAEVLINWYAEEDDYDMVEMGEDLQEISELEFNMVLVDEL